jgi:hypothetical protein
MLAVRRSILLLTIGISLSLQATASPENPRLDGNFDDSQARQGI